MSSINIAGIDEGVTGETITTKALSSSSSDQTNNGSAVVTAEIKQLVLRLRSKIQGDTHRLLPFLSKRQSFIMAAYIVSDAEVLHCCRCYYDMKAIDREQIGDIRETNTLALLCVEKAVYHLNISCEHAYLLDKCRGYARFILHEYSAPLSSAIFKKIYDEDFRVECIFPLARAIFRVNMGGSEISNYETAWSLLSSLYSYSAKSDHKEDLTVDIVKHVLHKQLVRYNNNSGIVVTIQSDIITPTTNEPSFVFWSVLRKALKRYAEPMHVLVWIAYNDPS